MTPVAGSGSSPGAALPSSERGVGDRRTGTGVPGADALGCEPARGRAGTPGDGATRTVLLVEDDPDMAEVVHLLLSRAGLRVTTVGDGAEGLSSALAGHFDVVVLDVLLPSMDGFEVCRRIRCESTVPIVMLTARAGTSDTVTGLELGADDYVTKPFEGPELVARVRAVLRRASGRPGEPVLAAGPFRLDPAAFKAWKADVPLVLTPTEFRLMQEFLLNPGTVLTREALLRRVWEYRYVGDTRLVDMAILRLRDKVEDDPHNPVFVRTVRGVGYSFELP